MSRLRDTVARLAAAGCVCAEEAAELLAASGGDDAALGRLVARRETGEPLAWISGTAQFCDLQLRVEPGVYVPRWQTEALARSAAARLPVGGRAVDLCTGCGAIARVLAEHHPDAEVVGTELDPAAAACARRNGATVVEGDLLDALEPAWCGTVDVIVGVLPYVPEHELHLLPRDVRAFEPSRALDGGPDGLELLGRAVRDAPRWLRRGGALLLEVGGDQPQLLEPLLTAAGFTGMEVLLDPEGDPRAVCAVLR